MDRDLILPYIADARSASGDHNVPVLEPEMEHTPREEDFETASVYFQPGGPGRLWPEAIDPFLIPRD